MGIEINSDEDFEQKFNEIDADQDGKVTYLELEEYFQLGMAGGERSSSIVQNPFGETRQLISPEFISAI